MLYVDKKKLLFANLILILSILPFFSLAAEGITILRHSGYSELLIDTDYYRQYPSSFIEIVMTGDAELKLTTGDSNTEPVNREFSFSSGNKPVSIYLHESLTGIVPQKIRIYGTGADFDLIKAAIRHPQTPDSPVPADIGHIIFSEFNDSAPERWRVYSWNIDPSVLIFDTRDYGIQSRLFKRLAFFVEKPGFTGTLVSNEGLEGKHGWNAHDYKADDLANFFNKAAETGFQLNDEELILRNILEEAGIIVETADNSFKAGTGAVLSVSRETLPNWRYRFLTHECLHGLFFTEEAFRSDIFEAFGKMEPHEIEFWKHLLDYRGYDVENNYLLVNEFMAYTLQQPVEEINEYFKGFLYVRMLAARPYERSFVETFDRNFPDSFLNSVLSLEKILYNHTGRSAGHLANIYPVGIKDSFFDLFPSY